MFVLVFFTVAMQLNYESLRNELRIITNLSSNERGANLQLEKLEINLHGKAKTCHLSPAMVKFISEFRSSDPMRTLLFLCFGYSSRFEARLLRYMEKIGRFSSSFKSSICQFSYLLYLTITLTLKHNSLTFISRYIFPNMLMLFYNASSLSEIKRYSFQKNISFM